MANAEKVGGVDSYVLYGVETTFGTAVAGTIHFGLIQTFSAPGNRNLNEQRGLSGTSTGGQEVAKYTLGTFSGTITMDFNVFDWAFMQYVLGARTGAGSGASPFVYTRANNPASLTVISNIDNDTTDRDYQFLGCKPNTLTIRAEVGSPVTASLTLDYADIDKDSTIQSRVALPTNEVMNFTGVDLERPDTTSTSNIIDSVEITIERNPQMTPGLGTDIPKAGINAQANYRINFTVKYLDEGFVEQFLGSSGGLSTQTETTLTVVFANGTNRTADWKFTGVLFPEYDNPHNVNEILTEGLTATARALTISEQVSA